MSVPSRTVKVPDGDWARHKETILDLYLKGNLTMEELASKMESDYGFVATISQFEAQLRLWHARKNLRAHEWMPILETIDKLPRETISRVLISGREVPAYRICRARKHCKSKVRSSTTNPTARAPDRDMAASVEQACIQTQSPNGTWTLYEETAPIALTGESLLSGDVGSTAQQHPIMDDDDLQSQHFESPSQSTQQLALISTADVVTNPGPLREIVQYRGTAPGSPLPGRSDPQFSPQTPADLTSSHSVSPLVPSDVVVDFDAVNQSSMIDEISNLPTSVMFNHPEAWFESLPYRQLDNRGVLKDIIAIQPTVDSFGMRLETGTRTMVENLLRQLDHDLQSRRQRGLPWGYSSATLSATLRTSIMFLPDIMFLPIQDLNLKLDHDFGLISAGNAYGTNIFRLLIFSMVNGMAGLEVVPVESVVKYLSHHPNMNQMVRRLLQTDMKSIAKAFMENLLRAAIEGNNNTMVTQVLATGRIDLDSYNHFIQKGIEANNVVAVRALVRSRVELKEPQDESHFYTGFLYSAFQYSRREITAEGIAFIEELFDAGANIPRRVFEDMCNPGFWVKYGTEVCQSVMSRISPSQHSELIAKGVLCIVASSLEDIPAARIVRKILLDCEQMHHGRCAHKFQSRFDDGIVTAAVRGHYELVHLLLDHCSLLSLVLSASLRGGNKELVDSIMRQQPDLNTDAHDIGPYLKHEYTRITPTPNGLDVVSTTPLAEAIRARNQSLINDFEQVGVLDHLSGGDRLEAAMIAAVEIRDFDYALKLISQCHDPTPTAMGMALIAAISNNHEELAMSFLYAGAANYRNLSLHVALEKRSSRMVRALLNAGFIRGQYTYTDTLSKVMEWGDESLAADLISNFDYGQRFFDCVGPFADDLHWKYDDYVWPSDSFGAHRFSKELAHVFARSYGNASMIDMFLGSKLATREILTACLVVALWKNDRPLLQRLVDQGANAMDENVLIVAAKWRPAMLHILLGQPQHAEPIITRGLRTNLIKQAIRQGDCDSSIAKNLIANKIADLHDTGRSLGRCPRTPLAEAIALSKKNLRSSFKIVAALLDAGCNPNDVVEWGSHINQTALLKAIEMMHREVVQLLLDHGANVNAPTTFKIKRTPLQKAAETGNLELVRMLISYGANANAEAAVNGGGTALQMAAISGNCNVVAVLLNSGALLHMRPSIYKGRWPLEGAAEHGRLDMIGFLWRANQDIILVGGGETGFEEKHCRKAMELAAEGGHFGCRNFIAELSGFPIPAIKPPRLQRSFFPVPEYYDRSVSQSQAQRLL
ncbi:hypothetical protein F5B20DRAFT_377976 [Whalleya microplaca]|nr:hypothetical protein F5B20DRAFT_377976 [Whalleya microplaca]